MTAVLERVEECNPTIRPKVVITPEVKPKLTPTLIGCFIFIS